MHPDNTNHTGASVIRKELRMEHAGTRVKLVMNLHSDHFVFICQNTQLCLLTQWHEMFLLVSVKVVYTDYNNIAIVHECLLPNEDGSCPSEHRHVDILTRDPERPMKGTKQKIAPIGVQLCVRRREFKKTSKPGLNSLRHHVDTIFAFHLFSFTRVEGHRQTVLHSVRCDIIEEEAKQCLIEQLPVKEAFNPYTVGHRAWWASSFSVSSLRKIDLSCQEQLHCFVFCSFLVNGTVMQGRRAVWT